MCYHARMANENEIRIRFETLSPLLDERLRRFVAAAEAKAIGHGGATLVSNVTGVSRRAIWTADKELKSGDIATNGYSAEEDRIRKPGGGRKKTVDKDPTLKENLDSLVNPFTRGDPESPLRWTCKSVRKLAEELKEMGHKTSHRMVAELLHEMGYSLQSNRKTREGKNHPDRDAQFQYINGQVDQVLASGNPAISVDTKKKELGRAAPYGIHDIGKNKGWVSVGTDHDTAEFAVATIRNWWKSMGQPLCPKAKRLLITADGGGSNGHRLRLWKTELQCLADEINIPITVCHFPPGTIKWNKIEHKLFSFITKNWRGKPLVSDETIINLIAATSTKSRLQVYSEIDTAKYPTGKKVTDAELSQVQLERHEFHGDWNYTISPS